MPGSRKSSFARLLEEFVEDILADTIHQTVSDIMFPQPVQNPDTRIIPIEYGQQSFEDKLNEDLQLRAVENNSPTCRN